ncbi:potassium transporter Kup [Andreprevotia chitinilytica]|uniref:potassium transporter Kup n=1 Tax=Andreprevotia chitinilytica TaxID=396808 RepID=UPI00054F956F|nr:potassium transporter Kup [Andreprevotia chitinilytica]
MSHTRPQGQESSLAALSLAALGVVYGDIGTSPLYTLQTCLTASSTPLPIIAQNVMGILSLIFWGLVLVVSLKYVIIILRADNRGEGGILSLMALALQKTAAGSRKAAIVAALGIFGAALFYGDSVITPAISVLSALEGVGVVSHKLDPYIVPLTIAVLVGLFIIQAKGTASVGKLFGPVMVVWFIILGLLGIAQIIKNPGILAAMSPMYAFRFAEFHAEQAFVLLGAVVLAFTGAEALYADMGHFGRPAIRRAWFGLVLPSLVLNYFGQGALLLSDPATIKNPFFLMAPTWALVPMVVLATIATVIASQAVISGAYSMTNSAIQLGFSPRLNLQHTSETEIGQIYMPQVNWLLLIAVVLLVLAFKSSANLAAAYGLAVTCTMVITTLLAFIVLGRSLTGGRLLAFRIVLTVLFLSDVLLFASNLLKVPEGGWLPLVIGLVAFTIMMTWKRGRGLLGDKLHEGELPLPGFVESLESSPPQRVEGVAIFMTGSSDSVPHALLHNLKHNKVLHETIVFLTVQTADVPFVPKRERIVIRRLGRTFFQVIATYGFKEEPNVPDILSQTEELQPELRFEPMETSYFLSRETIVQGKHPAISRWRAWLFTLMARNSVRATQFFKIPPNRVVEMGTQVEI